MILNLFFVCLQCKTCSTPLPSTAVSFTDKMLPIGHCKIFMFWGHEENSTSLNLDRFNAILDLFFDAKKRFHYLMLLLWMSQIELCKIYFYFKIYRFKHFIEIKCTLFAMQIWNYAMQQCHVLLNKQTKTSIGSIDFVKCPFGWKLLFRKNLCSIFWTTFQGPINWKSCPMFLRLTE